MKAPVSLFVLLVVLHSLFMGSTVQKACERKAIEISHATVNGEASALGIFLIPARGLVHSSIRHDIGGLAFKDISIVQSDLLFGNKTQCMLSSLLFLRMTLRTVPLFIKGMTLRL